MPIHQTSNLVIVLVAVLAFSPAVAIAEAPMQKEVRTIPAEGHAESIFCVAFSLDGKRLASGGSGGDIVLWDTTTWREVRKLAGDSAGRTGHFEDVWGMAFSPDGKRLASASHDETIRLWNVATGEQLLVLKGHSFHVWGVAFSPDGTRIASAGGRSDANGQFTAGEIKVWDATTGQVVLTMTGPKARVYSVAFSPDGKMLASGWEDKIIRCWDTATGQERFSLKGHEGEVNTVVWSPDGKTLASGSDDQTVRLWDVATHQELRKWSGFHGVAFSSDGKRLALAGAAGARLRDTATGAELRVLKEAVRFSRLALRPDGKQLVWDHEIRAIQVWTPAE